MKASNITINEDHDVRHHRNSRSKRTSKEFRRYWQGRTSDSLRLHAQQADQRHAARKKGIRRTNRDALKSHLHSTLLPQRLNDLLCSTLRQRRDDPSYDIADAFIDLLTTLRADCDAGREARWVGSQAGVPVDYLHTREQLVAWLQGGSPTAATSHHGNRTASVVATVSTGLVGANGGNAIVMPQKAERGHHL